jgi:hypothetical protein
MVVTPVLLSAADSLYVFSDAKADAVLATTD